MFWNWRNLYYVGGPRMLMCTTIAQLTYQYLVTYSSLVSAENWNNILQLPIASAGVAAVVVVVEVDVVVVVVVLVVVFGMKAEMAVVTEICT